MARRGRRWGRGWKKGKTFFQYFYYSNSERQLFSKRGSWPSSGKGKSVKYQTKKGKRWR